MMIQTQMDTRDEEFIKKISSISHFAEAHSDLVSDDTIYQLVDKVKRIKDNIAQIKQEGRLLKIGIVGSVKAGKSSFLNALVFNGRQILPKAATPMTAALTKLSYAQTPQAKITFYQLYDWKNICRMNKQYEKAVDDEFARAKDEYRKSQAINANGGIYTRQTAGPEPTREQIEKQVSRSLTANLNASHELVSMVEKRRLNPNDCLGREVVIPGDPNDSPEEYIAKLEQYVGANGKYTPLVNHIELTINNPLLEGFEIIDTPGLNDPIVSRSQATKAYLMNCDVVLIVCPVGQFLTSQDISLISGSLGQESVANAYIIGSQLDSGILQYNKNERSLNVAWNKSLDTYIAHAEKEIEQLAGNNTSPLVQRLRASLPPVFVSALIFGIAQKMKANIPLETEEQHILDRLRARFTDFNELIATTDDFEQLANIADVKDRVYQQVREQKNSIIEERISTYTSTQTGDVLRLLETINMVAKSNLDNLRNGDAERLREKQALLKEKLDSIRLEVRNIFDQHAADCICVIEDIKVEVSKSADLHSEIEVETTSSQEARSEHYGFLGLWKRNVVFNVVKNTAYASQAAENVRRFSTDAQKLINVNLSRIFNTAELKQQLKDCVIGAFDMADQKFNAEEILLPLDTMLKKISVSEVTFDSITKAQDYIYNQFPTEGGVVEGNHIHALRRVQEDMMVQVIKESQNKLDSKKREIFSIMETQSATFVDQIIQRISANLKLLQKLIENREESISRYERFIDSIEAFKLELKYSQE